ncbi:AI-2E family transporter [Spirosoma sp. KUDC1026]|uniref:AI-2E family transporter n=1 Tax=Spirosoma sp. KUDC1026 TaxID=2745947 RepID=UPI00159BDC32|nr:AI-2E family transporter [Spirosoma sp. KUDC1026]QKZ14232.1 AI-2E family transporter [Spirosoma sp. KUDC1026]
MPALIQPTRFLIFLFLLFGGLYFARPVLVPLTISGLLATLLLPLSNRLERKGVNRALAASLCLFGLVLLVGVVLAVLTWQSANLSRDLAGIGQRVTELIDQTRQFISSRFGIAPEQQKAFMQKQSSGTGQLTLAVTSIMNSFLDVAVDAVLTVVYTFLLLYFRKHLKNFILRLVSQADQNKTHRIISQSSQVAQQYLTGMAMMIGMLWVLYGIGFSIVGVKQAIFLAILCGLLEMIPFIGNLSGSLLTILLSVAQGGDSRMVLGIVLVYGIVQFTQTYLIEPLVVGNEVNINPLFTILVIVIGETVWGIPGMILALPVLGIVKVICDHVESLKPYGFLIGQDKKENSGGFIDKVKNLFPKRS